MTPEQIEKQFKKISKQICCLQIEEASEFDIPTLVSGQFLTNNGTDLLWAVNASTTPISSLLAATGTNTIDNTTFSQIWQWNTMTGQGLVLSSSSIFASSKDVLTLQKSGNNGATNNIADRCLAISNTSAGSGTNYTNYGIYSNTSGVALNNIAGYFTSSGGTTNTGIVSNGTQYAALFLTGTVGMGTSTPVASAALEIVNTTKGFLPPRMTTAQKNAIGSPAEGLIVYDTDIKTPFFYNGTAW